MRLGRDIDGHAKKEEIPDQQKIRKSDPHPTLADERRPLAVRERLYEVI
jgi:hypothetical protein